MSRLMGVFMILLANGTLSVVRPGVSACALDFVQVVAAVLGSAKVGAACVCFLVLRLAVVGASILQHAHEFEFRWHAACVAVY